MIERFGINQCFLKYWLSNKKFSNGEVATGAQTFASGTWTYGTTLVTINLKSVPKGKIWINLVSTNSGYESTIDTIEVIVK